MSTLGNILWFIFGGWWMGLGWWLAGLLCAITIVANSAQPAKNVKLADWRPQHC